MLPRGDHLTIEIWSFEMRMRKKADLPEKICASCGLPFAWRKKWEKNWDEVKYCSERCRGARNNKESSSIK